MLFKILHGDESRISTDITPFHEGWAYVTHSGNFYVDMNIGTVEVPNNQRIKLNANQAESLVGYDIATILNSSDVEIPTSKAVLDALAFYTKTADLSPVATSGLIDDLSLSEDTELIFDCGDSGLDIEVNDAGGEVLNINDPNEILTTEENEFGGQTAIIG